MCAIFLFASGWSRRRAVASPSWAVGRSSPVITLTPYFTLRRPRPLIREAQLSSRCNNACERASERCVMDAGRYRSVCTACLSRPSADPRVERARERAGCCQCERRNTRWFEGTMGSWMGSQECRDKWLRSASRYLTVRQTKGPPLFPHVGPSAAHCARPRGEQPAAAQKTG